MFFLHIKIMACMPLIENDIEIEIKILRYIEESDIFLTSVNLT